MFYKLIEIKELQINTNKLSYRPRANLICIINTDKNTKPNKISKKQFKDVILYKIRFDIESRERLRDARFDIESRDRLTLKGHHQEVVITRSSTQGCQTSYILGQIGQFYGLATPTPVVRRSANTYASPQLQALICLFQPNLTTKWSIFMVHPGTWA